MGEGWSGGGRMKDEVEIASGGSGSERKMLSKGRLDRMSNIQDGLVVDCWKGDETGYNAVDRCCKVLLLCAYHCE